LTTNGTGDRVVVGFLVAFSVVQRRWPAIVSKTGIILPCMIWQRPLFQRWYAGSLDSRPWLLWRTIGWSRGWRSLHRWSHFRSFVESPVTEHAFPSIKIVWQMWQTV
jgi:hypothetical protein